MAVIPQLRTTYNKTVQIRCYLFYNSDIAMPVITYFKRCVMIFVAQTRLLQQEAASIWNHM